ncbi:hypothetical protein GCM10020219_008840 [Nonomuraea dietziae]
MPHAEKAPGKRGDDDLADAELPGDEDGVHGARAAEGDQGELARLHAVLDRERADGLRHLGVGDVADALGQLQGVHVELCGEGGDGLARRVGVEPHEAAGEPGGVDPAEDDVGVGHGGPGAAPAVTGRSRYRPRRLGADAQRARLGVGDGAAARADGVEVDDGHQDGKALDAGLGADVGPPADDEGDVEGGAAHVDADGVVAAEQAGGGDPAHGPADRSRQEGLQGAPHRVAGVDQAAGRLHDVNGDGETALGEALLDPGEVGADDGARVGLEHGRGGALVLAPLPGDFVG